MKVEKSQTVNTLLLWLSRFYKLVLLPPGLLGAYSLYKVLFTSVSPLLWIVLLSGSLFFGAVAIATRLKVRNTEYSKAIVYLHEVAHTSRELLDHYGSCTPIEYRGVWIDRMNAIINHIAHMYEILFHQRPHVSLKQVVYCITDHNEVCGLDLEAGIDENVLNWMRVVDFDKVRDPDRRSGDRALHEVVIFFRHDSQAIIDESKKNIFYRCWKERNTILETKSGPLVYYTFDREGRAVRSEANKYRSALVGPICYQDILLQFVTVGFQKSIRYVSREKLNFARYTMKSVNDMLRLNLLLFLMNEQFIEELPGSPIRAVYLGPEGWDYITKAFLTGLSKDSTDDIMKRVRDHHRSLLPDLSLDVGADGKEDTKTDGSKQTEGGSSMPEDKT